MDNNKYLTKAGVFATKAAADRAVADLRGLGFSDAQIGLVTQDENGKAVRTRSTAESAPIGVGIAPEAVPVLGPVLTVGTICTVTLTADGGSALASLTGTLIDWRLPEEDAAFYEQEVQAGRCLVTINCGERTDVLVVFARHGGYSRATARAGSS